ncbi:MAG: hypothetical protein A3D44_02595 [Candidatus Staskawiczbacteria bacterium RIFCSPHIGHO2_02_FULL_42_22]|uniref:Uncharacterized protein n=1 Tax=Candidatus Staskawiczbacteria bacterium RIFCSPHIGHO2_02_FULL_42_22 TaxID=1802207 RepID=A0A1G2I3C0_9BACT|nr:MAG: hypothetical protein A3D44_02595 [Candidatus Staskawiczbacteria bacterium RIFCSPHIGHO2_02_FULL_42_22]
MSSEVTSPQGLLMLIIAGCFDIAAILIFLIEVWVDLGIFSTLVGWTGLLFVLTWAFLTGRMSVTDITNILKRKSKKGSGSPEKIAGSSDMKDWKQNKDGVYELQNKESPETDDANNQGTSGLSGFTKKFGWGLIVELVPWISAVLPMLTMLVWRLLRDDSGGVSQNNDSQEEGQSGTLKMPDKKPTSAPQTPAAPAEKAA